ncbi:glyoxalase [Verrucomicrobia bacterium LW23]|nr:glyoxalase [Verrucomicrobia bacterium LW23]
MRSTSRRRSRILDHIDLRVPDLAGTAPFYNTLLPELGFCRAADIAGWLQYYAEAEGDTTADSPTSFFGVAQDALHRPNATRIAFWAESPGEVDRLGTLLATIGARNIEGPAWEHPGYYAVFFEDPAGNRLEICHRTENHGQVQLS